MARIYNDITETIGNTPLVRLNRTALEHGAEAEILLKLEFFNPLSSVKDRIGAALIDDAFNSGRIIAAVGAWQMGSVMGFFGGSYPKAGAAIVFVYLIGMIAIWFAPETKGRPLPE